MTHGQMKKQAQQAQPSKQVPGTPTRPGDGHPVPSWDTDLGCAPLTSSTSTASAPAPLSSRPLPHPIPQPPDI